MVVIDEEEFIDLDAQAESNKINPFTGQPAKFKMDKFYGKDMNPSGLSREEIDNILKMLESDLDLDFTASPKEFEKNIQAIPLIESRPPFFSDQEEMKAALRAAEVAETKMSEAEKFTKIKRRDRLKLFHNCLKEYLNNECDSNYKVKYDK